MKKRMIVSTICLLALSLSSIAFVNHESSTSNLALSSEKGKVIISVNNKPFEIGVETDGNVSLHQPFSTGIKGKIDLKHLETRLGEISSAYSDLGKVSDINNKIMLNEALAFIAFNKDFSQSIYLK